MILFGKKSYYTVFGELGLAGKLKDFTFDDRISPSLCVVKSKGEILALTRNEHSYILKIFKRSSESRTLCEVLGRSMRQNATLLRWISMPRITFTL